jgi:hypothetical protein
MTRQHEKLLVAILCGLVLTSAAIFAVSPASAAGYEVYRPGDVVDLDEFATLSVHREPTPESSAVGELPSFATVWIERCREIPGSSDWCKIYWGPEIGWVDARHLLVQ